jgi:hypothetical protein
VGSQQELVPDKTDALERYEGVALVERLISDAPKLHFISESDANWMTEQGLTVEPGPTSWAVPPQVLRYFAIAVKPQHLTIETGAGYSTVALAVLARHHTCITIDQYSVDATRRYLDDIGVGRDRVTFIVEPSDSALPKLGVDDRFNFAYVDGEHGYPVAALDWHYIDKHLEIGGIVGFDNVEIPSVHNHCEFMEMNGTYRLVENVSDRSLGRYGAYFYEKLIDQGRSDVTQLYNRRRVAGLFPQGGPSWPWT